jgi:hypothetical protein
MATTSELILRFTGDSRQLRQVMAELRTELSRFSQGQVAADQTAVRSTQQSEQRRIAETIKSANLRLREEQRSAREVARIMAETARQAAAQERVRERAAKQLSDVQIREAKRAAKELEASLKSGSGGGGFGAASSAFSVAGRIPGLSGLTSELGSFTSATEAATASQASLAGPIGLVAVAAIAQATAMLKLHEGLFSIAKQTADFEGRLFDMSQQVGVSVETLSTLEVLATTTGGNIESVAASLGIFQKNLEAAHDPTSKEAKLLAQLGVTSSDTEEALAQTLTGLFKLGEGSRQTAAVLELFGRSGRFVNAILKESEGDLEKARAKFEALGIVVGTDAARAADQFNDNLALIDFQIRGLIALIGNELIPVITGALEATSKLLKDNKDAVEGLGFAVKVAASVLATQFFSALGTVDLLIKTHRGEIGLLKDAYDALAAAMQLVTNSVPQVPENLIPPVNLEGQKSGLTLLQDLQQLFKQSRGKGFDNKIFNPGDLSALDDLFKKTDKANKSVDAGVSLLRQLQTELRNLTEHTKAQDIAQQLLDERYKNTSASLREQIAIAAQLIDVTRARIEVDKKIKEEIDKQKQATQAAAASVTQFLQQQAETLRRLQFGTKSATDEVEEFIEKISLIPGAINKVDEEWLRFRAHLIDSIERMKEMLDLMREQAAVVPGPGGKVPEVNPNVLFDPVKEIGIPPPPDFSVWEDAISHLRLMLEDFSTFATTTVKFAFDSLIDGIADAARSWVLYGDSIGKALKRALAEMLASVAAQALVQAALHAAYAIGNLAFGNFAAAAQHALAAAKFAAVAAIAGLAGRAIAGNSFSGAGASSSASSGGGGSGSRSSTTTSQPKPVDLDRTSRNQQAITLLVNVKQEPGAIVQVTLDDHRNNGPIRQMILSEIGG